MSNQDLFILIVGLGVIVWASRRPLAGLWRYFAGAERNDESRQRVWRLRILFGAIFVPPVGIAICNFLTRNSLAFSGTYQFLIDSIPGLAWVVYAAWISKRKNRWIGIAKWGLIVFFARALTIFAAWLTRSPFQSDFFWQVQWFQLKSEAVYLFGALILLMIGGRIFRLHLAPANQAKLEPPRITIPFLMLMQALVALAISLMVWVLKSNQWEPTQGSFIIPLLTMFCFCLSTVLSAFAILLPSRVPRWALILMLVIGAVGLRMTIVFLWYREMRLDDDPQKVQMADAMLYIVSWQVAVHTVWILGVFALIRLLFRKAGLVIVRAGFSPPTPTPTPIQTPKSIYD